MEVSATASGAPSGTCILKTLPLTVKPIHWLSADQNGCAPFSVPRRCTKRVELSRRRYSESPMLATTILPSGEISGVARLKVPTGASSLSAGGFRETFQFRAGVKPATPRPREYSNHVAAARIAIAASAAIGSNFERDRTGGASNTTSSTEASSSIRSRAHCQRSSGSLARHRLRIRSIAGGTAAVVSMRAAIGGGSGSRVGGVAAGGGFPLDARLPAVV